MKETLFLNIVENPILAITGFRRNFFNIKQSPTTTDITALLLKRLQILNYN